MIVGKYDPKKPNFGAKISAKSQTDNEIKEVDFKAESKVWLCWSEVHCCILPDCPPEETGPAPTASKDDLFSPNTVGNFIERMWAYQTIKWLLKLTELEDDNSDKNRQQALDLSLKVRTTV